MVNHVKQRIEAAFASCPSILDGGLGTELQRSAPEAQAQLELLPVSHPKVVRKAHAEFQEAGAQWLTTHTFSADPASLRANGLAGRSQEITQAAVSCCRAVAKPETLVLGSIGPSSATSHPTEAEARGFIECLVQEGVDGLLIETQMHGDVLRILLEQALQVRRSRGDQLFIAVSLVVDAKGVIPASHVTGETELLAQLQDSSIDLLALNCSTGSQPLQPALERLRPGWSGRLGAYPNAGFPVRDSENQWHFELEPAEFASEMKALQQKFQLDLIGGCCGVSPAHIHALCV